MEGGGKCEKERGGKERECGMRREDEKERGGKERERRKRRKGKRGEKEKGK